MKKLSVFLLQVILITGSHAQMAPLQPSGAEYPWQLGIGIGYTNYYGDVSNYRIKKFSDIGKLYHFADFNHYYVPSPSISILLEKKITPTVGFMLQFNQVSFSMSDRYRNKNGSLDLNSINYARSLNFKTNLQDAGFALTFSAANDHAFKENSFFYPSFYLGGGVALFNVYGDLYDANGNSYDYTQQGYINDGHFETNLRDIKTETLNRYSNVTPYLDFGLALNFRVSSMLTLSLQSDIKYSGTDYLDDVSGHYKQMYPSAAASYAARPGYNIVDPVTLQRGDANDVNDIYINNRVVLHINLSHKKNRTVFRAPAVYSLAYGPAGPVKNTALIQRRNQNGTDSSRHIVDSLVVKPDTLPVTRTDTAYQNRVENRLDSIQHQLKGIKTVIRNQAFEARYNYLHYKQDSLKLLKKNIQLQRVITREDNLKMRIYDLQSDSIRNEIQQLQRRAEAGMDESDSSWKHAPTYFYNMAPALVTVPSENISTVLSSSQLAGDTLTDQQLAELSGSFSEIKKDQRYAKDSAYRKTIDSLNNKLQRYDKEKRRLASAAVVKDTAIRSPFTVADDRYKNVSDSTKRLSAAVDSLQMDSAAMDKSLRIMQVQVQKSNDSLRRLQAAVKQNRDSASYYNRMAFAAKSTADSVNRQPRKWYQRIIPGSSKKNLRANEAETQQIDEREQYYNIQLSQLNDRLNDLQRRNQTLNQDYDRNRRRREETVYRSTPTTVVRETGSSRRDNNDLRDLRNEISALRNQLILQQAVETGVNNRIANTGRKNADTVFIRTPIVDSARQPAAANPQMAAMQQEITRLKTELEGLKTPVKTEAVAPVAKEKTEPLTVYFGLGSATLTGAQLNKFSAYGKKLSGGNHGILLLTGYTDAVGNATANNALARKRMLYIQQILVTRFDIAIDSIRMEEPVIEETGGGKPNALSRKVTVKPE